MNETCLLRDQEPLRGPVALCHLILKQRVGTGGRVADATCGNGNDTLFLVGIVGGQGRVWSFDIDKEALDATRDKLRQSSLASVVELVHAGHERLSEYIDEPLNAVVFNLGYLPGGAKSVVTRPETTLAALEQALGLLLPGGVILLVVYTGHPGGEEEGRAVDEWASGLPSPGFNVWCGRLLNRRADAPYLLMVEKAA
jgi:ubiquinone/menaquinone biosynthesis C-methylase UbiE